MFVVSRTFVAINILRHLATREDGLVSSTDMAKDISIPLPYVRKVANQLIRAGIIKSVRGYSGGLALARPSSAIRLGDVLNVVEETRLGREEVLQEDPLLSDVLDEARSKFLEVLNEHSIADFCSQRGRSGAVGLLYAAVSPLNSA